MTPEIERACNLPAVQTYLARLEKQIGQEVNPRELLPPFNADFRRG